MGNAKSGRGGVDYWVHQRVRRLAMVGLPPRVIARQVGIEAGSVPRLIRRALPKKWRRCACGALADRVPCLACQLRALRPRTIRPITQPRTPK